MVVVWRYLILFIFMAFFFVDMLVKFINIFNFWRFINLNLKSVKSDFWKKNLIVIKIFRIVVIIDVKFNMKEKIIFWDLIFYNIVRN